MRKFGGKGEKERQGGKVESRRDKAGEREEGRGRRRGEDVIKGPGTRLREAMVHTQSTAEGLGEAGWILSHTIFVHVT